MVRNCRSPVLLLALLTMFFNIAAAECAPEINLGWAVFTKTQQGWRASNLTSKPPIAFRNVSNGDVIQRVGRDDLRDSDAIAVSRVLNSGALNFLQPAITVLRFGKELTLTGSNVNTKQDSGPLTFILNEGIAGFPVLRIVNSSGQTTLPEQGDRILAVNDDPLLPLQHVKMQSQADFKAPVKIFFEHSGGRRSETIKESVRLWVLPLNTKPPDSFRNPVLRTLNGQQLTLQRFRGRWTLLHFWATWCRPCVEEMPRLAQLKSSEVHLTILAPIFSDREEAVRAFLKTHPSKLQIVSENSELNSLFAVTAVPYDVLLAPDGSANMIDLGAQLDWVDLRKQIYGTCAAN